MLFRQIFVMLILSLNVVWSSDVIISGIEIEPSEEGMVLIAFSFNNGHPEKYKVSYSEEEQNSLIVTFKDVAIETENIMLDVELNEWMKVAQKKKGNATMSYISFELQKQVPFKSYFSEGKLYVSFADVRYSNTLRTVLLWLTIPIAIVFTATAYLLIENQ